MNQNQIKSEIEDFLTFEKTLLDDKKNKFLSLYWPALRINIFNRIFGHKNISLGENLNSEARLRKINFTFILKKFFYTFQNLLSFRKLFKSTDILVINCESKLKNIDAEVTTQAIWSLSKSLSEDYKITIINPQNQKLKLNNKLEKIDFGSILSISSKIFSLFYNFDKHWKEIEKPLNQHIESFYKINIDWKYVYSNYFVRNIILSNLVKLSIILSKPKVIFFSDNGNMGLITKYARKKNIRVVDYQHGALSNYYVTYNHSESIGQNYKDHLPEYFLAWGSFRLNYLKENYNCIISGNPFFEYEINKVKDVKEIPKTLVIISDGHTTRDDLIKLAIYLSQGLENYLIYYKLRPEEYSDWRKNYKELLNIDSIKIVDTDLESLYLFLKKSSNVIGTCSTVLVEAIPLSNVIVLEKGWYFEMEDYIREGYMKSSNSFNGIKDIIQNSEIDFEFKKDFHNEIFRENSIKRMQRIFRDLIK